MTHKQLNSIRFLFGFVDILILNLVHASVMLHLNRIPNSQERYYLHLFVAANTCWLFASYSTGLYSNRAALDIGGFTKKTLKSFLIFNVLILLFIFIYHYPYSRLFMALTFTAFLTALLLTRLALAGINYYLEKKSNLTKRVVIVGYNEIAKKLVNRFMTQRKDFYIDGYFEEDENVFELSNLPVIGNIDECLPYALANDVKEIYSTVSPEQHENLYEIARGAEKSLIRFKFVPDFRPYVNHNTHIEYMGEIPILSLRPEPLEDVGNAVKKRLFDIAFSLVTITFVLSWLTPIIAIIIKLTSKGPIFFIQSRSGKDNKPFKCIKFRTLHVNKEAHNIQVTKNDKRLYGFGRFLRKTNLDELPQFLNVLFGDMSVIGPRPHMLNHTMSFSKVFEEYMIRHFIKPGVTGWAQVNGYRGEIKQEEQLRKRIEYDIWYMENWSLWLDLKIVWLTAYNMVKGEENAY